MRRILSIVVPAALLVGLGLTTVASAHDGGEHLHLVAKPTSFEKGDLGDGGKQFVVNFDVFEHHHDTNTSQLAPQGHNGESRAGHGVATCVTSQMGEGALCSAAIELEDGQLSVQGVIHRHSHQAAGHEGGHGSITLPVTGGSGKFLGAAGEVEAERQGGDGQHHAMAFTPADREDGHHHAIHLTFHLE